MNEWAAPTSIEIMHHFFRPRAILALVAAISLSSCATANNGTATVNQDPDYLHERNEYIENHKLLGGTAQDRDSVDEYNALVFDNAHSANPDPFLELSGPVVLGRATSK